MLRKKLCWFALVMSVAAAALVCGVGMLPKPVVVTAANIGKYTEVLPDGDEIYDGYFTLLTNSSSKPVFSASEMAAIVDGANNISDYGFVMLEPADSYVVFEIVGCHTLEKYNCFHNYSLTSESPTSHVPTSSVRFQLTDEGYYEFDIQYSRSASPPKIGYPQYRLRFAFYVAKASNYATRPTLIHDTYTEEKDINGVDCYYYNFGGATPYVQYDNKRFAVDINASNFRMDNSKAPEEVLVSGSTVERTFDKIGKYEVTTQLMYFDNKRDPKDANFAEEKGERLVKNTAGVVQGVLVPVKIYEPYLFNLTVFGVQAYFENYDYDDPVDRYQWFGDTGKSIDADITKKPGVKTADYTSGVPSAVTSLAPVITNTPPVHLFGNVLVNVSDCKVWYNNGYGGGWVQRPFVNYGTYEQAGEYVVVVDYSTGNQVFYFKIIDFVDMRIKVGSNYYYLNDVNADRKYYITSASDFVFYYGDGVANSFDTPFITFPRIDIHGWKFDGTSYTTRSYDFNSPDNNKNSVAMLSFLNDGGSGGLKNNDGNYWFRVYYGNLHIAKLDFHIVVDNTKIEKYDVSSTAKEYLDTGNKRFDEGIAIFGVTGDGIGDATLSWAPKASGVEFLEQAAVSYYKFEFQSGYTQPSYLPVSALLDSPYKLSSSETFNAKPLTEPVYEKETLVKWQLKYTFTSMGLYVITIKDYAGNDSVFVLIIDGTSASFVQSEIASLSAGGVNITKNAPSVNMGATKVIQQPSHSPGHDLASIMGDVYEKLGTAGVVSGNTICIPIEQREVSNDYRKWTEVDSNIYTIQPGQQYEDIYYFRSTDIMGNQSFYYVYYNSDESEGIIIEDDNSTDDLSDTASLVRNRGISNCDYVTFAFNQSSANQVANVKLTYYELTYQTTYVDTETNTTGTNTNYPFSYEPTFADREIYNYSIGDNGQIFVPINRTPYTTKPGLYVITRTYSGMATLPDTNPRRYYFIVDTNPIISRNFTSDLTIDFGAKTAGYANFQKDNNAHMNPNYDFVIQSNAAATIKLPANNTKYGGSVTLKNIAGEDGKQLVMNSLELSVELERDGELQGVTLSNIGSVRNTGGMYKLALYDGSGGLSWKNFTSGVQGKEANRSEVLFELLTDGPRGNFYLGNKLIPAEVNSVKITGAQQLSFEYYNDDSDFFAYINENAPRQINTGASWVNASGLWETAAGPRTTYTWTNNINTSQNGYTYMVTMTSPGSITPTRSVYVNIDNTAPAHNINRVRGVDTLYSSNLLTPTQKASSQYVYGIPNDFVFEFAKGSLTLGDGRVVDTGKFDTDSISYYEVDSNLLLLGFGGEVPFDYFDEGDLNAESFSEIVDLKDDETRFFQIVESDEAGNTTSYYVQLKGEDFKDTLKLTGLNIEYNDNFFGAGDVVYGKNIGLKYATDAETYLAENPYAVWTVNATNYAYIGGDEDTGTLKYFTGTVLWNAFLNPSTAAARTITINDRFEVRTIQIIQIRDNAPVALPDVSTMSIGGNLSVVINNYAALKNYYGSTYADFINFKLVIYEIDIEHGGRLVADGYKPSDNKLIPSGGQLDTELLDNKVYEVRVTDVFDREVVAMYYGPDVRTGIDYWYNGNSKRVNENGVITTYTGDNNGFELYFNDAVYAFEITKNGNPVSAGDFETADLSKAGYINIRPDTSGIDESVWEVKLVYKSSNLVKFEERFKFCYNLPKLTFSNASGGAITAIGNGEKVSGNVTVSFSNHDIPYPATVTYVRSYPDASGAIKSDTISIGSNATQFVLKLEGIYTITVINEFWARKTYTFEILDVSNTSYKVYAKTEGTTIYDDMKRRNPNLVRTIDNTEYIELVASPAGYSYNYGGNFKNIAHYFALYSLPDDPIDWATIKPEPSANYNRTISTIPISSDTTIYRLKTDDSDIYIFFAVTFVQSSTSFGGTITNNAETVGKKLSSNDDDATRLIFNVTNNDFVTIGLANKENGAGTSNVIYTDYYYDFDGFGGMRYAGRLFHGDKLRIYAKDYGRFRFYVYDWAGNRQTFGTGDKAVDYYTVTNLSQAPLLVNGRIAVNGMVYNNELNLSFIAVDDPSDPQYSTIRTSRHIRKLTVEHNGKQVYEYQNVSASSSTQILSPESFTENGFYRISCEYNFTTSAIPGTITWVTSEYTVQLVSDAVPLQSFVMSGAPNLKIVGLTWWNMNMLNNFPKDMTGLTLSSASGSGMWTVTVAVAADNIRPSYMMSFRVQIQPIDTRITFIDSNVTFGTSTKGVVTLTYVPRTIYEAGGGASTLTIKRNGAIVADDPSTGEYSIDGNSSVAQSFSCSEVGTYTVTLTNNTTGQVYFSEVFQIKKGTGAITVIFIVILVGIAAAGVVIFLRLRRKMRVR